MNYFKKWKYYFIYSKEIKKNRQNLKDSFKIDNEKILCPGLEIDKLNRCYTIVSLKQKTTVTVDTYGYYYMDNLVKDFVKDVDKYFRGMGFFELVGLSKADQVDKNSILLVFEYKHLNLPKIIRRSIIYGLLGLITLGLFLIF
jgi:hypothetical protein